MNISYRFSQNWKFFQWKIELFPRNDNEMLQKEREKNIFEFNSLSHDDVFICSQLQGGNFTNWFCTMNIRINKWTELNTWIFKFGIRKKFAVRKIVFTTLRLHRYDVIGWNSQSRKNHHSRWSGYGEFYSNWFISFEISFFSPRNLSFITNSS